MSPKTEKHCSKCSEKKKSVDYYITANKNINQDGRLPICKICLTDLVDMKKVETLIEIMRALDRPFLKKTYDASLSHQNPFGEYMRMLATPQNRSRTYLESEFEGEHQEFVVKGAESVNKRYKADDVISFKVTPEILLKWGDGYSETEMYQLESFYTEMHEANNITSPQHIASLKLLCKLNMGQNKALNENKVNDFKNLNTQYNKVLQDSGLRPIDTKAGGESVGIRTFSQIWEEIEKDGFIPPHPIEETQDIVDRTILYTENNTRQLLNMMSLSEPPQDTPKVDGSDEE